MPFRFRWPFSWPRRKRKSASVPDAGPSQSAASAEVTSAPAHDVPGPVQLSRAERPQPPLELGPAAEAKGAVEPEGADLGLELLGRLPSWATPPTLGRLGGLTAMAQTLPTVERFLQKLPLPPPQPTLPGLGEAGEFAAKLPSLVGFTEPGSGGGASAFPAQLEPPSEPTDVLAPPGGMPGQIAGLSGAAAVLEPSRPAVVPPVVAPLPAAPVISGPGAVPPAMPTQRATEPTASTAAPMAAGRQGPAAAPPVAPKASGLQPPPAWTTPPAPMTQVLTPEQTLIGNVLPAESMPPIQREALRAVEEEWRPPADLVQPGEQAGERVTPEQRDSIESQRGQGRQLEPETRQRFEQAYGQPLDEVRVHTGPSAHSTAESLNAIAFASGKDLFFTQNSYEPDSPQGLSLIGHELAHVIQQQYGVTGDADALRPPDDRYERQADQLAARALDTPIFHTSKSAEVAAEEAPVQRAQDDEQRLPGSRPVLPAASTWAPGDELGAAAGPAAQAQPFASALPPAKKLPEDQPVQRFATGMAASLASAPSSTFTTSATPGPLPGLQSTPQRVSRLTDQLLSPPALLSNAFSLSQYLPGLGRVIDAGQGLPVFRSISRGLPGLGSLPDLTHSLPELSPASLPDTSALEGQLPDVPSLPPGLPGLGGSAPAMPDLGSVAKSLGGGQPQMPGLPTGLPSSGGLTPPEMPLAEGLGAASQAAGEAANGALAAGQEALGSITGMAPSGAEGPAGSALPSLDKLTEHIWKEVQRKLKVERERSRGLA